MKFPALNARGAHICSTPVSPVHCVSRRPAGSGCESRRNPYGRITQDDESDSSGRESLVFSHACQVAAQFTRSVVVSWKPLVGDCQASIGAFIVINDEGWIATASHILRNYQQALASQEAGRKYLEQAQKLKTAPGMNSKQRRKATRLLGDPSKLLERSSIWWSWDDVQIDDFHMVESIDLAIGKLKPFDPNWISRYPEFKDPDGQLHPGTSICRLGYPFHSIVPEFDESADSFTLPAGTIPAPFFASEGIYSRNVIRGNHEEGWPLMFMETSSPGLKGQSGGPIFDSDGTVWGIQSQTVSRELGFTPKVKTRRGSTIEHQFMNTGLGAHPVSLMGLLDSVGVRYAKK